MIRQISLFDAETGEFISSNTQNVGNKLKEGWIVIYKDKLEEFIKECPNFATMKVYMRIAAQQDYKTITFITPTYIAKDLGLSYPSVWAAVKWLEQHAYLRKVKENGSSGFIVNPTVTTCGKKNMEEKLGRLSDPIPVDVEKLPVPDFANENERKKYQIKKAKEEMSLFEAQNPEFKGKDYDWVSPIDEPGHLAGKKSVKPKPIKRNRR